MTAIDNRSGLPHAWFEKTGPGEVFDVLAVRGTFDFAPEGGRVTLATEQAPIVYGDEFDGPVEDDPLKAVLHRAGDLVLYKPGTDVHVMGTAQSKDSIPVPTWLAAVRVGPVKTLLRLHGPRRFERRLTGWRLTLAEPTSAVALDYRLAFGGTITAPATDKAPAASVSQPHNPAGCGWLPDAKALKALSRPERKRVIATIAGLKTLAAPQIEHVAYPVRHPAQAVAPQGTGPIARWWAQRIQYAGTYDERWQTERHPALPDDFDPRFYHSASPDLICSHHLKGDEDIHLVGLLPDNALRMWLPGWRIVAVITTASGQSHVSFPVLDTVDIDLDTRQVSLVWRASFGQDDPAKELMLGATTMSKPEAIVQSDGVSA